MSLSLLWNVFFIGWFASEIYIAIATRTRIGGGKVRDRGTMLLLWGVIAGSITACLWIGVVEGQTMPGSKQGLRLLSVIVIVVALVVRWAAILTLGKAFSANVAIRSTQTVLKTGLYRWMRHPSYTGLMLCFVAVGIHARNWVSLGIVIVGPMLALSYRIYVEEIALREHFGEEYLAYARRTKRLIPGVY